MSAVVHAVLLCSDERCAAIYEAYGPLEEIEAWACDCGCSLAILRGPYEVERPAGDQAGDVVLVAAER